MKFEVLSEPRHTFNADSTQVAFLTMMMLTRGLHGIKEVTGDIEIPALHPNEAGEWAQKNLNFRYSDLLFSHIHRDAGRKHLLDALDSVEPVGMGRKVSGAFGMHTGIVQEARDVAAAIRAIPLPYRTDEEAQEAQKAALEKEKEGKDQEKAAE